MNFNKFVVIAALLGAGLTLKAALLSWRVTNAEVLACRAFVTMPAVRHG